MSVKINDEPHTKKYYPVAGGFHRPQPGLLNFTGGSCAGCFWASTGLGTAGPDPASQGVFFF